MTNLTIWVLLMPLLGFIILGLTGRALSRRAILAVALGASGLAFLLDLTATLIAGGLATHQIAQKEVEVGVSQVYIAFDVSKSASAALLEWTVDEIVEDLHRTLPDGEGQEVLYPGERVLRTRQVNLEKGIPVDEDAWRAIREM